MTKQPNLVRRQAILDFIGKFQREHDNHAPSLQMIGAKLEISSTTTRHYLAMLVKEKRLVIRDIGWLSTRRWYEIKESQ